MMSLSSLQAFLKGARIFKDYAYDFYFRIHGLSWRERLTCSPLLLLVESMVYQVDATAERAKGVDLNGAPGRELDKLTAYKNKFIRLLERLNVYDPAIAAEVEHGEQYVRLENRVTVGKAVGHADVMRIAELRPSDVRLLHRLLFRIRRRPYDEALLSLLWPVEVIADIGNDFNHYADDRVRGNYNTYQMFVTMYGEDAPARIRAEIKKYEDLFRARLAELPVERRAQLEALCVRFYQRHTSVIPSRESNVIIAAAG